MIEVKRRKNESTGSFLYRFNKRVQQSGVLKEVRKRKSSGRPVNRRKRKLSAVYKSAKARQVKKMRKLGYSAK